MHDAFNVITLNASCTTISGERTGQLNIIADFLPRGHSLKLVNNRYHYDLRKFSFAPRIVNVILTAYQK